MRNLSLNVFGSILTSVGVAFGASPADTPRPVPLTRPEMKRLIEDVKVRQPRIPLPELTDADKQALGDRAGEYEAILRHCYTPWVESRRGPRGAGGAPREQDPAMTLDYAFKTQLFWIVSRANNCQYCIGHQESKLLSAGLNEDQIAALDGDWLQHTPAERAAFAFARKLSFEPYTFGDADIDVLRKHYSDLQILEMVLSVSGNNVSNRWKEAVAVPQRKDEGGYARSEDLTLPRGTYLTATSAKFENVITKVAPLTFDKQTGEPTRATVSRRPALESRSDAEKALADARQRQPRLPLVDEAKSREILGDAAPSGPLPQWVRLLANFPREGLRHLNTIRLADEKGDLSPLLKAQLSWIVARHDGAWYAAGRAQSRLRELGQSADQVYALDGDWKEFTPRERALFTVAKKLAASPVVLTDADVAKAVELASPRDVVQTAHFVTTRALFDRITEAAGLQLE